MIKKTQVIVFIFLAILPSFLRGEDATPLGSGADTENAVLKKEFLAKAQQALGLKSLGNGRYQVGLVKFDSEKKEITIPAKVNMQHGFVEYALVHSRGKVHESIFVTDAEVNDIHKAVLLLSDKEPQGKSTHRPVAMEVRVEWQGANKQVQSHLLLDVVELGDADRRKKSSNAFPNNTWRYNNAMMDNRRSRASGYEGSVIALIRDRYALINNIWLKPDPKNVVSSEAEEEASQQQRRKTKNIYGNQKAKKKTLPVKGTPVTLKLTLYQRVGK